MSDETAAMAAFLRALKDLKVAATALGLGDGGMLTGIVLKSSYDRDRMMHLVDRTTGLSGEKRPVTGLRQAEILGLKVHTDKQVVHGL